MSIDFMGIMRPVQETRSDDNRTIRLVLIFHQQLPFIATCPRNFEDDFPRSCSLCITGIVYVYVLLLIESRSRYVQQDFPQFVRYRFNFPLTVHAGGCT